MVSANDGDLGAAAWLHVAELQADKLADADAGGVKYAEHGAVTTAA